MVSEDLKRQIGQHFVFGFMGYEPSEDIVKLIRDYHVGNIIIFKRNIQNMAQIHALVQSLQQIAKDAGHTQPLLIGIDQENGMTAAFSFTHKNGAGTQFPGAMAMGAAGDLSLAENVSAAAARELRQVGINWAYSPVADVNSDPRNPVIGVRSFGENATLVSSFVCAVIRGLEKEGIASTAKHFPGHGDTHVDSHKALPIITKDVPELEETELVPFRAAIDVNISSIMTGHMSLPKLCAAFDEDVKDSPASISGATHRLLRDRLGFKGVIVTDCLEMDAISGGVGCGPGAVQALQAGADIVMICHRMDRQLAALEATYAAVDEGTLSVELLKESAERIQALKEKYAGRWDDILGKKLDIAAVENLFRENTTLSRRAYASTTKWLTETTAHIKGHDDVLVLTPRMEAINPAVDDPEVLARLDGAIRNTAGPAFFAFSAAVARHVPFSTHVVYSAEDASDESSEAKTLEKQILSASVIVFATRNAHHPASHWQFEVLKQVLDVTARTSVNGVTDVRPIRVIVLASCAPYDISLLRSDPRTNGLPCLCTYEFTKAALEEAAAKLYGESLAG